MADPLVIHDDLELFLVGWYRAWLQARPEPIAQSAEVSNREPSDDVFPEALVVIRDMGGTVTSVVTAERDVGISVLAGTVENPKAANDLARLVHAARTQIPSPDRGNPVAAVVSALGPSPVPERQPRARRLINLTLSVVPTEL